MAIIAATIMAGGAYAASKASAKGAKASQQQSGPAYDAGDLQNLYGAAIEKLGPGPTGDVPAFQGPGDYQQLFGREGSVEDYATALGAAPSRRLTEDRDVATDRFRADLATRGMLDDPAAFQLEKEAITTPYTRALGDIQSGATASAYGARLGELENLNQYNLGVSDIGSKYGLEAYRLPRDYYLGKMQAFQAPLGAQQSTATGGITGPNYAQNFANIGSGYQSLQRGEQLRQFPPSTGQTSGRK